MFDFNWFCWGDYEGLLVFFKLIECFDLLVVDGWLVNFGIYEGWVVFKGVLVYFIKYLVGWFFVVVMWLGLDYYDFVKVLFLGDVEGDWIGNVFI